MTAAPAAVTITTPAHATDDNRAGFDEPSAYLSARTSGPRQNWRKHCREYNACGEGVFFVRDSWYNREYVPHDQKRNGNQSDDGHDQREEDGREDHKKRTTRR